MFLAQITQSFHDSFVGNTTQHQMPIIEVSIAEILADTTPSSSHLSTSADTSDSEQAERHGIIRERNLEWQLYQIHAHWVRRVMGMPWIDERRIYRYEGGRDFTLKVNIRENLPNNNIYLNLRTNKFEVFSQNEFDDWEIPEEERTLIHLYPAPDALCFIRCLRTLQRAYRLSPLSRLCRFFRRRFRHARRACRRWSQVLDRVIYQCPDDRLRSVMATTASLTALQEDKKKEDGFVCEEWIDPIARRAALRA